MSSASGMTNKRNDESDYDNGSSVTRTKYGKFRGLFDTNYSDQFIVSLAPVFNIELERLFL